MKDYEEFKHLKKVDYLIYCMWCGKLYLKGKEVEIEGDDNENSSSCTFFEVLDDRIEQSTRI